MNYSEEWKEIGKKAGLTVFIMIVFLAIPIVTSSAQNAMKGDPVIVCASSELILSKERRTANTEKDSYGNIILFLDVQLKAMKHFTSTVNATLRFKDSASLAVEQTMTGEKNDPKILRDRTTWSAMKRGKAQSALRPFTITGFQRLPEKIAFELDVTYRNPNDQEIYSTTLSIIPWIPDTTIDIIGISNPPDKYKGEQIPISITIKNEGSYNAYGIAFWIKIRSYRAGSDTYNWKSYGYENSAGKIELTQIYLFSDILAPGAQKKYNVNFNYAHTNGAMNVGEWDIIEVAAQAYNSDYDVVSEGDPVFVDPRFKVKTKSLGNGPHAVFIYYLWEDASTPSPSKLTNWPENPRPYFEHTTYGSVKAGLYMFEKQYNQRTDNYIDHKMIICKDDASLSIGAHVDTCSEIYSVGIARAGSVLNTKSGSWSETYVLDTENCGFDILLIVAYEAADHMGQKFDKNCAVICAGNTKAATYIDWKYNIDGIVQHELGHIFNCKDCGTYGHLCIKCIMVYRFNTIFDWDNYLFERFALPTWFGNHDPTNQWCTDSNSNCCTHHFQDNWHIFYAPAT